MCLRVIDSFLSITRICLRCMFVASRATASEPSAFLSIVLLALAFKGLLKYREL